jgi:hypothetical protein
MHKGDKGRKRAAKLASVEKTIAAARLRTDPETQGVSALAKGSKRLRHLLEQSNGAGVVQLPIDLVEGIVGLPEAAFGTSWLPPKVHAILAEAWNSPEGQGWLRLCERLDEVAGDPLIVASQPASEFLTLIRLLAGDSVTAKDGMRPIRDLESVIASQHANGRHEPMRATEQWVAEEWAKYGAKDYKNNKSAFARDYSARCIRERGVKVTDRTIREKWLKR